jgi:hypothetical protein
MHSYNLSAGEIEARGSEFEASLGYRVRLSQDEQTSKDLAPKAPNSPNQSTCHQAMHSGKTSRASLRTEQ